MTKREVGRPRTFSDDDVFRATNNVLASFGHGRLTLESVANGVGCTRQALVRRFGSKHALVREFLEWTVATAYAQYSVVKSRTSSPLQTLRARFLMPVDERPGEIWEANAHGNVLAFFIGAREDPEFNEILNGLGEMYQEEVSRLIRSAQEAGEIGEGDPGEIAFVLIAAASGAILSVAAKPSGSVIDTVAKVFDLTMKPYLSVNQCRMVRSTA